MGDENLCGKIEKLIVYNLGLQFYIFYESVDEYFINIYEKRIYL